MRPRIKTYIKAWLPRWIYNTLIGDWDVQGVRKYAKNTGWMFAARAATFITSFFTIAIVARYLGPENLGRLSYAQSFVAILSVFATLGIDQILLRDLTAKPELERELLGTAITSKLIFGTLAFLSATITSVLIGNDPILTVLIAIMAGTFLLNPVGTIGILFQARVEAKYSSQATIFLAFFIPLLKLLIVFFGQGVIYFALVLLVESAVSTLWLIYAYTIKLQRHFFDLRFSLPMFKKLMFDAWPLLLAALSGYTYARIDQVMIQHFINSNAVGFYDVAVRLTDYIGFLPGIIMGSVLPAIINAKKQNRDMYLSRFKSLLNLNLSISFISAASIFVFAPWIVTLVFGNEYLPTITVLRIYVWSSVFIVPTLLLQHYFIIEGRSIQYLIFSFCGAVTNVILNLIMIPMFGMQGAAYATLSTLIILAVIFGTYEKYFGTFTKSIEQNAM